MQIQVLPKAELHVHIEGTLEPELLVRLARRNAVALPSRDPEILRTEYQFTSLQTFLNLHYRNMAVLRTETDFYELTAAYLVRAANAGVRRAEIFFDPQQHLSHDVPLQAMFAGISAALTEGWSLHGISADLIMCFLRDRGPEAAMETLRAALPYREHFIGVGLDSTEIGYPPEPFRDVFATARTEGLHLVAHAGEEAGPDYVWQVLDVLGVERIDHGIRAMEDINLVRRLKEEQIPLTVCPLSNVALHLISSMREHVLPQMIAAGLKATISSDDPAYFGGYIDANFNAAHHEMGLTEQQLVLLAHNSFDASFSTQEYRNRWKEEVNTAAPVPSCSAGR